MPEQLENKKERRILARRLSTPEGDVGPAMKKLENDNSNMDYR